VLELSDRFRNLEIDSRLEIAFEGNPKGFAIPSYSVYNHKSMAGIVIFELETRVTARYSPLAAEYKDVEIEHTDSWVTTLTSQTLGEVRNQAGFLLPHSCQQPLQITSKHKQ
jgi:hypothetical protein